MTVSLFDRGIVAPTPSSLDLHVRRQDIDFRNIAPNRLQITVTVTNRGDARSEPTIMALQAAPLGAFVPWRDLTSVDVPSIGPYESVEVTAEAEIHRPRVLGNFSRVPPRRLLTAISGADDRPARGDRSDSDGSTLWIRSEDQRRPRQGFELPDDLLAMLSRPNVHWAGNINVLIGNHAVERHMARALRIYSGRPNLAVFIVGDQPDEYQFEMTGSGVAWGPTLFDGTDWRSLGGSDSPTGALQMSQWIKMPGARMVMLGVEPPHGCDAGGIDVHVRQRSTDREAVVEFSLDPNAAGPGCYFM